ncbi:Uncharacterised protein [Mycobacteroides abscessus subsp. abscessus]|nr:Uncharacterised protein [Mycobacteroides abscessus subsp. abscessus]
MRDQETSTHTTRGLPSAGRAVLSSVSAHELSGNGPASDIETHRHSTSVSNMCGGLPRSAPAMARSVTQSSVISV